MLIQRKRGSRRQQCLFTESQLLLSYLILTCWIVLKITKDILVFWSYLRFIWLDPSGQINSGTTIHVVCLSQPISCLLVHWQVLEPVHQQAWYWPQSQDISPPASEELRKTYRKISNIRLTKSPNLNVPRLVLQFSLPNPMKLCARSSMKM